MNTISEQLETPVMTGYDIAVFGAGSAGIAAAIAAGRQGARVVLVDPAGYPGGTLVSGLPILGGHDGKRRIVGGIYHEIYRRLADVGAVDGDPEATSALNVDPERLKVILLEMLRSAGVDVRLHTLFARAVVEDRRITHAVVEGKGGRRAIAAPMYVDTTGDADIAYSSGVPCEQGRKADGKTQAMTLMFGVGNIDKAKFEAWGGYARMVSLYVEIAQQEEFRNPRRTDLSGCWGASSRAGEWAFNVTRVVDCNGADAASLSRAEVEGRMQAWEFLDRFLKPNVPGFENAYIVWTAAKIGVRETRRIVGEYVLNEEDILSFRKFEDTIVCGSYPIDIHSPTGDGTRFDPGQFYGGRYWTIPYRSLVPLGIDNLLVAGRCLSATHEALSAVRVMANTIGMGEAAGIAARMCLARGVQPRNLDAHALQSELRQAGAWLCESLDSRQLSAAS